MGRIETKLRFEVFVFDEAGMGKAEGSLKISQRLSVSERSAPHIHLSLVGSMADLTWT